MTDHIDGATVELMLTDNQRTALEAGRRGESAGSGDCRCAVEAPGAPLSIAES